MEPKYYDNHHTDGSVGELRQRIQALLHFGLLGIEHDIDIPYEQDAEYERIVLDRDGESEAYVCILIRRQDGMHVVNEDRVVLFDDERTANVRTQVAYTDNEQIVRGQYTDAKKEWGELVDELWPVESEEASIAREAMVRFHSLHMENRTLFYLRTQDLNLIDDEQTRNEMKQGREWSYRARLQVVEDDVNGHIREVYRWIPNKANDYEANLRSVLSEFFNYAEVEDAAQKRAEVLTEQQNEAIFGGGASELDESTTRRFLQQLDKHL